MVFFLFVAELFTAVLVGSAQMSQETQALEEKTELTVKTVCCICRTHTCPVQYWIIQQHL